ncbi:recombinase family protein [Pseudomonas sp. WS 5111]|uniref:recombinase family protein n=1 Tax=Pseudomonas sp. WS 5111 TaxID=2717493 RepID=UPI0014757240|nr:recombinase family protein [Pseudomonas sp. WS 5111]NMX69887.1 recombinase family protein [Pseudomonas sp. WS 5111]
MLSRVATKIAHSYIRFSSVQQATGDSLKRQQDMLAAWMLAHPDYTLSSTRFTDLGISGFTEKHLQNGFGKLLVAIEHGDIASGDVVLIEAIDRAGRFNPNNMLHTLTGITKAGVRLITLDDGLEYNDDPNNANNLFLLVAKCQQAHQYSAALSARVKAAYAAKREKAAKGERVTRRTPLWLDSDGKLILEVAPYIVQAFEDYASGIGERRIAERIRSGHSLLATLNPSTIRRWLVNPTAIGNWKEIPDVYPAVITKELWFRVQKRMAATFIPKSSNTKHLLSGLVKCGLCGKNFGVLKNKKSVTGMTCMTRHRMGTSSCQNSRSIPYVILDYIRSQTSHSALQRVALSQRLTDSEKRLIEVEGELQVLHKQSENVAQALSQFGLIPAITAQLESLQKAITALEAERHTLAHTQPQNTLWGVVDAENDLLDDDPVKLNSLLQGVGYSIVCHGVEITVSEATFESESEVQHYTYLGAHRPTNTLRLMTPHGREDFDIGG